MIIYIMINYKYKYNKYKNKYIKFKNYNSTRPFSFYEKKLQQFGGSTFKITGPISLKVVKVYDKIFYLFGDSHREEYKFGCEYNKPELCDIQKNCYNITTFIINIINANITSNKDKLKMNYQCADYSTKCVDIFLESRY